MRVSANFTPIVFIKKVRSNQMPLGLTEEEYNDPCCGCGCKDDIDCEECSEKLISEAVGEKDK
jgi:hypothetical protein